MKKITFLLLVLTFVFAQTYDAGDIVSDDHQNQTFEVCYGDYPGGQFSLADLNGAVNGGDYYITFINMSTTW